MIDLTPYSILSVTVITSVFIVLFILITRNNVFVSKISMWIPVALTIIMCIRLLFPIEFLFCSKTLLSFDVFPHIDNVIYADVPVIHNVVPDIKITVVSVFCAIWLIGAIVFIVNYIKEYVEFCRATKHIETTNNPLIVETLNRIKTEYNFKFDVKIIFNNVISEPSEFGFFKQTIFLNDYDYSPEELSYILTHELTHFYNKSNWIKLFMNLVKSILWWNPVVHLLQRHVDDLLEIYVDTFVTKNKNHKFRLGYIKCIQKVLENAEDNGKKNVKMKFIHSMAAVSKENIVMRRCNVIRYGHKNNIPICILIVLVLILYIFISSRYVVQPAYEPPVEDKILTPNFTEDNSYIVKEGDVYILYYNGEPYYGSRDINRLRKVPIID